MKKVLVAAALLCAGYLIGQSTVATPSTVLHVVTVKWNKDATPAQRQAAIDGVKTMAQAYPGIKRVWLKTIKVQPQDYSAAIAMEFADRKAFDDYVQAPAHSEWKKLYDPAHEASTTHDLTN
jgi:hypothetical protein